MRRKMKPLTKHRYNALPFILCIFLFVGGNLVAQEVSRIIDLRGLWRFTIGDDSKWSKPDINTSNWEIVKVPSSWENEGFHGYDGYAWYRKSFKVPSAYKGKSIVLDLGRVDDADEVFINGQLIGYSGSFPPNYSTAYYAWRKYTIPTNILNYDKDNVIAVRVFDAELDGGILEGNIGLYEMKNWNLNLVGVWKFATDDDPSYKDKNYNDRNWNNIYVPGNWEVQGFEDYNGFAWYRYTFFVPDNLKGKKLVLLAGKIDDFDETYINGKLVGTTGPIDYIPKRMDNRSEWQKVRAYEIPENTLQFGKENTIAIRVYDGYVNGGIYEGPIAILTQENYTKYWRKQKSDSENFWEDFWNDLFN